MKLMVGVDPARHDPAPHVYLVDADAARDLTAAEPAVGSDLMTLARGDVDIQRVARTAPQVATATITPALPIARPGKIICLGLNYVDHAKEGGYEVPTYPAIFLRAASSIIPAGAPIVRPAVSDTLDYEAELLMIVGEGGRNIPEETALDHVFGYTCFNDASIRDYQRKTHQWTAGKNFDDTGACGPVVVTADALPPGAAGLSIQTRLNGAVLQNATTADMIFPTARTIALMSEVMTLEPGDLIALGTPPGVGHARRPPVWMRPGDTVEIEIEGIGVCRNPIIAGPSPEQASPAPSGGAP